MASLRPFRRLACLALTLTLANCASAPDHGSPGAHGAEAPGDWSYSGTTGPAYWAGLQPYFRCGSGREQSPIDLGSPRPAPGPTLDTRYQPTQLTVVNTGHDPRIPYDRGSRLWLEGVPYDLTDFHIHAPAEHLGGGLDRPAAAEVHLVHSTVDNQVAVIALRLVLDAQDNPFLEQFWNLIPSQPGRRPTEQTLDVSELLPRDLSYFQYMGSLTTPPCGEGVRFFVLRATGTISQAQLDHYRSIFGPTTARPPQPLNGRTVTAGPR